MARSSSNTLAALNPKLRPWAEALIAAGGAQITLTSVRRSRAKQELLWRRYLNGLSAYPAAPPGTSKHELGLAFDIYSPDRRVLRALGELWESWGGVWGGRTMNDPIHFEAPGKYKAPVGRYAAQLADARRRRAAGLLP